MPKLVLRPHYHEVTLLIVIIWMKTVTTLQLLLSYDIVVVDIISDNLLLRLY